MASAKNSIEKHRKVRRGNKGRSKDNNNQISIMHANVRGLKSKVRDIISLVEEMQFDMMILSETKLCNEENRVIRGYKNYRLNRTTRAGGVVIYYKDSMDVQLIKKNVECETLWVKIKMAKHGQKQPFSQPLFRSQKVPFTSVPRNRKTDYQHKRYRI